MSEETKESKKKSNGGLMKILMIILIVVLIIIAGGSSFMYWQAQKKISQLSTPNGQQSLAKQQVTDLLTRVGKHMLLPANETPTVATVTDVNSLKKAQPFFAGAENGDQVLVYVGAKKAIIYSPKRDVIVNVGFVAVDNSGNAQPQANTTAPVTVEVRNGTKTSGLGQKVADAVKNGGYTVQKVTDAKNKDYTQTEVFDTGKSKDQNAINTLAQGLNAQVVTTLPDGEADSTADVVIFIGSDKAK